MTKRLKRWAMANAVIATVLMAAAGTFTDPWLWAYVAVVAATTFYALMTIDEDLARERFHPPSPGADRVSLRAVRLMAVGHLLIGALDAGRWHLAPVASPIRAAALAGMAAAFWMVFYSMRANRFFSSVVRIQTDRGHHVVDRGPYAIVRHPGYAGMILGVPLSGLALGSWLAAALALAYSALIFRRVLFEDGYLRANLAGYEDYAARVRYRLVPGAF